MMASINTGYYCVLCDSHSCIHAIESMQQSQSAQSIQEYYNHLLRLGVATVSSANNFTSITTITAGESIAITNEKPSKPLNKKLLLIGR